MKTRLLTSLGIVIVLVIAFILKIYVSNYFFDALILAITCFASYEASKLFTKTNRFNNKIFAIIFPAFLMLALLLSIEYDSAIGIEFTIVIAVGVILLFFLIAFIWSCIDYKSAKMELKTRKMNYNLPKYSFFKALNTTLVYIYPAFLLMFLTLINHFEDMSSSFTSLTGFNGWISVYVLLFAFLVPIFTDTFAYITGGLFGGKKLAPKISPNKTISGAIGGFLWCILLSVVVFCIFDAVPSMSVILQDAGITLWKIIIIAGIGSVISQLGDLAESSLKRSAEVKDSGSIFPGHGGMLDRFDSYVFVAPFIFIAFSILFAVI